MTDSFSGSFQFYKSWGVYQNTVVNLLTDSFKMLITNSSYVPDAESHSLLAHINNEIVGNGYERQSLSPVTWNRAGNIITFDFPNPTFIAAGGNWTGRNWVVFDDTPVTPLKPLVAYGLIDSSGGGQNVTVLDGGYLEMNVNNAGFFTLTIDDG